jgi:hypothetical protein
VTDQRNRITTDPGLGPAEPEHHSTLRSMVAADPVEDHGAPVYYEPKPLNAASEHKTLELQTVKLAKDIDPRKLPTELKLRRPVLHILPASDPNWPAPIVQPGTGWPPQQYDSGWPPPETVLTTSQPPQSARRRSFVPLVLLVLLSASLLLLIGLNLRRWSAKSVASAQRVQAATFSVASPASASTVAASESAPDSSANASAAAAEPSASATPPRSADAPHHATSKPIPPATSTANSRTLSAPPTARPKRSIY